MNNNRNNRRRGRGNRNQGSNGAQLNRIDSRARGNAPQMLDKYKKLAQDAQHHGDRVQMEYHLQFADHYFRVIADNKARMDEQRGGTRRPDDRDQAEDYDDDFDFDRGRRSEAPTRSVYEQQDNDPRGEVLEGEPGQEGEAFVGNERGGERDGDRGYDRATDRGDDRDDNRQRGPRRQQPHRKPKENGREDNRGERRPERSERPERAAERAERPAERPAERAERPERPERTAAERSEKPARARRPRKAADDDGAGNRGVIDSSILPPSIRGDDSGSSDGALETVG